jgi:hypothetical protein
LNSGGYDFIATWNSLSPDLHHPVLKVSTPRGEGPGTILWTSGALPGKAHDLTAARIWGILHALEQAGIITLADKAYQGAEGPVLTPYKGKNKPEPQKQANRAHAKLRGPGERANAQLKSWKILRKLRCSPSKAGHLCKAIAVLQNLSHVSCPWQSLAGARTRGRGRITRGF